MAIKRPMEQPFIAMPKSKKPKLTDDEKRARQREYSRRHREKAKAWTAIRSNHAQPLPSSKRTPLAERDGNARQAESIKLQKSYENFPNIEKWLEESSSEEALDAEEERVTKVMMESDDEDDKDVKSETSLDDLHAEEERVAKVMMESDDDEFDVKSETSHTFVAAQSFMVARCGGCDPDEESNVDDKSNIRPVMDDSDDDDDNEDDDEDYDYKSDISCTTERQGSYKRYEDERFKIYDSEDRDRLFSGIYRMVRRKRHPRLTFQVCSEEDEEHAVVAVQRLLRKYPERVSGLTVLEMVEVLSSYGFLRGLAFRV